MLPTDLLASVAVRLAREPGARVLWTTSDRAHLAVENAQVLVVRAVGEALPEGLHEVLERVRSTEIHLVLVGGGAAARKALRGAELGPWFASRGVRSHVATDGDVWTEGGIFGRGWMRRALREAARVT